MTFQSEARRRRDPFSLKTDRGFDAIAPDFEPEPFDDWLDRTTRELGPKLRKENKSAERSQKPRFRQTLAGRAGGKPRLKSLPNKRSTFVELAGSAKAKAPSAGSSAASVSYAGAHPT